VSVFSGTVRREPAWVRFVNGLVDGVVIAFCIWTVFYEVALMTQASARATVLIWTPLALLALVGATWRAVRRDATAELVADTAEEELEEPRATTAPSSGWLAGPWRWALVGTVTVLAVVAGSLWLARGGDAYIWLFALLVLAAVGLLVLVVADAGTGPTGSSPSGWAHLAALLVALALAALMNFVLRGNQDDVYYVNRAVWVAQHGTFPLRDTMFGPELLPSSYPFPFASIEGLFGALAGLVGVGAPFFSYVIGATFFCAVSAWAAWRLTVAWAPRRHLLVFLLSVLALLAASRGVFGAFSYYYMWAGKTIGLCLMVPLAWVYFTRLAQGRGSSRWAVLMLAMCGLGFVGMTPTAVLMAPLLGGAAIVAAIVTRQRVRQQVLGAVAFLAGPVLAGLAVIVTSHVPSGGPEKVPTAAAALFRAFGHDAKMTAVLVVALVVGTLLVRRGHARALAVGAVVATVIIMVPGFAPLMNAATGSAAIYNRLFLTPPLAILVGMLVTVPLPARLPTLVRGSVVAAGTAILAVVVVLAGTPIWTPPAPGRLVSDPSLPKVGYQPEWRAAEDIAALGGEQLVLAPPGVMRALTISSTRAFSVVPRKFYLPTVREPQADTRARITLLRFVRGQNDPPQSRKKIAKALERLDVTTVCLPPERKARLKLIDKLGYDERTEVGYLVCLRGGTH
jgi:hypothetical protein